MQFPVYISVFGARLHPHIVLELFAYAVAVTLPGVSRWRQAPPCAASVGEGGGGVYWPLMGSTWMVCGAGWEAGEVAG